MSSLMITIVAGLMFFLGLYLSFDYWYARIWLRMLEIRDQTVFAYGEIFVNKTPERVMNEQLALSGGLFAVVLLLTWPHVVVGLFLGTVLFWFGWKIPLFWVKNFTRPSRVKVFSTQMVDALTLMANGLKSGLNVPQTLQIVVDEMPAPISQEFGLILSENKIGVTLEAGFEKLAQRIGSEDVQMFATSVNILRETGGNIAETFQTITKTIRERMKLQSKISAMTAQGMSSAVIVGSLPWGLGAMLYLVDPVTMAPLFKTIPGWGVLCLILLLESIGFIVILKIVKIRV